MFLYTALLGLLFPGKQKESALSLLQVGIAVGFVISFVTGIFLSYITQLWIICGFILLTTITYTIVFFANATKAQLAPCIYKEPIEDDDDNNDNEAYEEHIFEHKTDPLNTGPVENGTEKSFSKETSI